LIAGQHERAESWPDTATLPWSWYSDPAVAERERERIFRRSWQYVGHLGELQGPGSYFSSHAGGVPVVVTLDRDERLRAFINVCRHRGAIVARGAECRGTLQCPYHAWTYGLDGALRAAPRSDAEDAFDRQSLGLVPASVGTWGPFVLVNPDAEAPRLADALGDLPAIVADNGLDVEQLRWHRRVDYELNANWKIALENYLECYHCQLNHPALVEVIDERALTLQARGLRLSQLAPATARVAAGTAPLDARGTLPDSQFHLLLPAMKFNMMPGHPNLSIGPVWPLRTDRCAGFLDYFFGDDADEQWITELYAFDDAVGAQDTALIEAAQLGTASGMIEAGRLLRRDDQLIARFRDYVSDRLAE
jgi:phenylpropionate dioxygenase-like ring-hydroxylating dioxygenase large terminal subunit